MKEEEEGQRREEGGWDTWYCFSIIFILSFGAFRRGFRDLRAAPLMKPQQVLNAASLSTHKLSDHKRPLSGLFRAYNLICSP